MTFGVTDHPDARAEYVAAVAYYDEQRAGLGDELIERFEEAVHDIVDDPYAWRRLSAWDDEPALRSRRVRSFRFRVIYYIRGEQVRIVAYAHLSREPHYWLQRLVT